VLIMLFIVAVSMVSYLALAQNFLCSALGFGCLTPSALDEVEDEDEYIEIDDGFDGLGLVAHPGLMQQAIDEAREDTEEKVRHAKVALDGYAAILNLQPSFMICGARDMGSIKRTLLGLVAMGSISDYLIHHAECPVLVIKYHASDAAAAGDTNAPIEAQRHEDIAEPAEGAAATSTAKNATTETTSDPLEDPAATSTKKD
ncbi:hypothetical protein CYMTET_16496, partial [Cymbomonas tetramitiformis]